MLTNLRKIGADRVCLGVITDVVGLQGEVRIRTFTSRPESIAVYGPVFDEEGKVSFLVEFMRLCEFGVVARLSGVEERKQAQALSGKHLYVSRTALPSLEDEEWYYVDLIGLSAFSREGRDCGHIKAVWDFGAGEILELERDKRAIVHGKGKVDRYRENVLIPFTKENVAEVNVSHGNIILAELASRFHWQ